MLVIEVVAVDPHRKHVACLEVYDEIGRTERLISNDSFWEAKLREDEGNELGISVLLREFVSKEIIIRNTVQMRENRSESDSTHPTCNESKHPKKSFSGFP